MIATLLVICSLNLQAKDTLNKDASATIALNMESASVKEILEALETQTSFRFFYNHRAMGNSEKITLSLNNVTFESALRQLADRADLVFKIRGDQVVVKKKPARTMIPLFSREHNPVSAEDLDRLLASLQEVPIVDEVNVSGQVLDEISKPMPGVNIIVKGTTTGVTTDVDGRYAISVPTDAVLVFSFVGYQTREVPVGSETVINITMQPDVNTLSEVVVVGYGTQKRASVTGAVSSIQSKEIAALAVPSVESALQGRVAGVNITNNGSPGTNPIVRIRGIGSVTGSSGPLYVVDGLPISEFPHLSDEDGLPAGGLNGFDPKDIESVQVLKDAAAAAIYGSRAAGGVILITTKKGSKNGGVSVNVDSYYGVQNVWKTLDLLKRDQYLQYGNALLTNAGSTLPDRFSNMNEPIYPGATRTYAQTETDWQDEMFRTAPIYQTQASVSAGNEKARMYSSAGVFGQDGTMVGTDFKRYNFRFNSEVDISKHVTFGQTLTVSSSRTANLQESGGRTILQHVLHQVPYMPVYDPTKLGGFRTADNNDGSDPENPLRIQLMDKDETNDVKLFGTAFMNISILPSLTYKFTIGGDFSYTRNTIDRPIYNDGFGARTAHDLQDNRTTIFSPLYQNQLTFDKQFGKHLVNLTAVSERQDVKFSGLKASAQQNYNAIHSLQAGANPTIGFNDSFETTLLSFLGRVNYEYAGKYLLSVSIRRDGFSGFAPGHKWGSFPGFSAGWRISEEPFMNTVGAISELKIRASYGTLGVNNVGPFDYMSLIGLNTTYPFNNANQGGAYFNSLANPELSWEKTKMTNFGIDAELFDGKISLTAEYFQRVADQLLLRVPLAPSMGYSVDFLANVGNMENKGFEFQAGYHQRSGEFTFDVTANVGTVRNKVTDLFIPGSTLFAGNNADFGGYNITKTEVGRSVQGFYGWVVDGIFQSEAEIIGADNRPAAAVQNLPLNEDGTVDLAAYNNPENKGKYTRPGDIRFKDSNRDGVINESDRTYLGSFIPDFTYGLNFSANYKNFDVTLFLQGVQGNEVYNGTKVLTQGMLRLFGAETDVLNAWTPANPNTDVPRAVNGDPNQNSRTSDRFLDDGSYMRVKNLSIGYTLPPALLSSFAKGSIRKLRIYASFQNLLTLTSYSGYDPEIGARTANDLIQGIDYGQYPQPRTIMGGVQLGF